MILTLIQASLSECEGVCVTATHAAWGGGGAGGRGTHWLGMLAHVQRVLSSSVLSAPPAAAAAVAARFGRGVDGRRNPGARGDVGQGPGVKVGRAMPMRSQAAVCRLSRCCKQASTQLACGPEWHAVMAAVPAPGGCACHPAGAPSRPCTRPACACKHSCTCRAVPRVRAGSGRWSVRGRRAVPPQPPTWTPCRSVRATTHARARRRRRRHGAMQLVQLVPAAVGAPALRHGKTHAVSAARPHACLHLCMCASAFRRIED